MKNKLLTISTELCTTGKTTRLKEILGLEPDHGDNGEERLIFNDDKEPEEPTLQDLFI